MNAIPVFMHPTLKYLTILFSVLLNPRQAEPTTDNALAFNGHFWKEVGVYSHAKRYTNRQRMLKDLQERELPGKSRSEIRALLGSGEKQMLSSYDREEIGDASFVYFLGKTSKSLFGPESHEWLCIYVDEEGVFSRSVVIEGLF